MGDPRREQCFECLLRRALCLVSRAVSTVVLVNAVWGRRLNARLHVRVASASHTSQQNSISSPARTSKESSNVKAM